MARSTISFLKSKGGLGVKHCDVFNRAQMFKWGWRILVEEDSLRNKVLSFNYGDIKNEIHDNSFSIVNSNYSLW